MKNADTGRRVLRLNPESAWIRADVPALRIVWQEPWDAAKARQDELTGLYTKLIESAREGMRCRVAANGASMPGICRARSCQARCSAAAAGGSYARRDQDR